MPRHCRGERGGPFWGSWRAPTGPGCALPFASLRAFGGSRPVRSLSVTSQSLIQSTRPPRGAHRPARGRAHNGSRGLIHRGTTQSLRPPGCLSDGCCNIKWRAQHNGRSPVGDRAPPVRAASQHKHTPKAPGLPRRLSGRLNLSLSKFPPSYNQSAHLLSRRRGAGDPTTRCGIGWERGARGGSWKGRGGRRRGLLTWG